MIMTELVSPDINIDMCNHIHVADHTDLAEINYISGGVCSEAGDGSVAGLCYEGMFQLAVHVASLWLAARKPRNLGTQAANSQVLTRIASATFLCCSSSPRKLRWFRI